MTGRPDDPTTLDLPSTDRRSRAPRHLALTVLWHPDVERVGQVAVLTTAARGEVVVGRSGGALPLGDPYVSRRAFTLRRLADGGARVDVPGERPLLVEDRPVAGAVEVGPERLVAGATLVVARRVVLLLHTRSAAPEDAPSLDLLGASEGVARVRREVERVAGLDVPVLIEGETGTGKELVARAIHRLSPRRSRPLETVNMAALARETAASALFGHARGAFTGAVAAGIGCFERADGGTLFLDEIGAVPEAIQPMLLRALESGDIQPVGAAAARRVDARVLAATDAGLDAMVQGGAFSLPLYHRLAACRVVVPPLRARRDDVGRLLLAFLREELGRRGAVERLALRDPQDRPWLDAEAVARLARYDWPGNVRELRNAARQLAVAGHDTERVSLPEALEDQLAAPGGAAARSGGPSPAPPSRRPADIDDDLLLVTLRAHGWAVRPAARALGISKTSLYGLIERCPLIRRASDVPAEELREVMRECAGDLVGAAAALCVSPAGLRLRIKSLEAQA